MNSHEDSLLDGTAVQISNTQQSPHTWGKSVAGGKEKRHLQRNCHFYALILCERMIYMSSVRFLNNDSQTVTQEPIQRMHKVSMGDAEIKNVDRIDFCRYFKTNSQKTKSCGWYFSICLLRYVLRLVTCFSCLVNPLKHCGNCMYHRFKHK